MSALPQSQATLYLQPGGGYLATSSGVVGELAVLVPVTDGVCFDDLDPNGNETSSDAEALSQDIYHILIETLGSNLDDLNRGVGVEGYLSSSTARLDALPSIIDSQLRKDTRIAASQTTLVTLMDGSFQISLSVEAVGTVIPLAFSYNPQTGLTFA
jgi:hypothetical protein